jgi:hypothetical protein
MHKDRGLMQGDLIGRTSALWAIIYISHFKKLLKRKKYFCAIFAQNKIIKYFLPKYGLGYVLGNFFHKSHPVTLGENQGRG